MIGNSLNRGWYQDRVPNFFLRTLEKIYWRGFQSRRKRGLAQLDTDLQSRTIIVVGNITAGGTGKTPLIIRLAELLKSAGFKPGVISRGYGRSSSEPISVEAETLAAEGGDEPVLIAQRCDIPVMVDSNREAAAKAAFASGVDVVLSDDGLQRWRLPRDIEICVVDGTRGLGNGHMLPAGPLREPAIRLESVDSVILNGAERLHEFPGATLMEIRAEVFCQLEDGSPVGLSDMAAACAGKTVHAVAGIGNPERFFDTLQGLNIRVDSVHRFEDHHTYRASDFSTMDGVILMTEKDAVKCRALEIENALYLRIGVNLPETFEAAFVEQVTELVRARQA